MMMMVFGAVVKVTHVCVVVCMFVLCVV